MSQHSLSQQTAQEILRAVTDVLHGSGFGSVEIVLHEGNVTLIEKRENYVLYNINIEMMGPIHCTKYR